MNWIYFMILLIIIIIILYLVKHYKIIKNVVCGDDFDVVEPITMTYTDNEPITMTYDSNYNHNEKTSESEPITMTYSDNNNIVETEYSLNEIIEISDFTPTLPVYIKYPNKRPETVKVSTKPPSKGERLCKEAVEKIFGVPFYSTWPDWLRNPLTGAVMELDLYNDILNIAIEYNGIQHYKYTPFFHKNGLIDFKKQVERDNYKIKACKEKGVYLIIVPYNCPDNMIENYIKYYSPATVQQRNALIK